MTSIGESGQGRTSLFIIWSYPGEKPTEVEYELEAVNGETRVLRTAIHEAIEVETPTKIRHQFIWNGSPGKWSNEGLSWSKPI
jgi:hypothetical protein